MEYAKKIANHPKIKVSDIEFYLKTTYTYKTIEKLQLLYPNIAFIWLMGADNLANFHKWKHWQKIIEQCPIAIFDRESFDKHILSSKLTLQYKGKVEKTYTKPLIPGRWHYFKIKKHPLSSTLIRKMQQGPPLFE